MKNYHSALKKELNIKKELDFYKFNGNIVLRHDICFGLPFEFTKCDVLYSEPAWLHGYDKFIKRADKEKSTYNNYILSLIEIVKTSKIPVWLVIGAHIINKFPKPENIIKINLHGYQTNLCGWNTDFTPDVNTNYDFIKKLSETYNIIGDFNCGYGNTGRIFLENNKKFVMSDINGKCIYYIAKTYLNYENSIS